MAKTYKGSLTLEWYNKQKAILLQHSADAQPADVPAPRLNWVNKDEALFYEIDEAEGKGKTPYWVDRNDIRVKEARPLVLQKVFKAVPVDKPGSLPGMDTTWRIEESTQDDPAVENILIKGDNLLALNTLKKMFDNKPEGEKVKCIYIDPPYNTGSGFEEYDDNLEHSEWLTLMRDRLVILRGLLRNDGSIWISIDDDESHYLKALCDEVFGRDNFLANVVWEKTDSPRMDAVFFSVRHEYILCYAKDKSVFSLNKIIEDELPEHYNKKDNDGRSYYLKPLRAMGGQGDSRASRPNLYFSITAPDGTEIYPVRQDGADGAWRWSREKVEQEKNRIEIIKGKSGWTPYFRIYGDSLTGRPAETFWSHSEVGSTRTSKIEIKNVFGGEKSFDTPKPERLIQKILTIATEEEDWVLDCFLGSGTAAAAANKMRRNWIGVEVGNHADTHIVNRLIKVIKGNDEGGITKSTNWRGGGSFKYYHLGESIIKTGADGQGDFNWSLGRRQIEENFLFSYDYQLATGFQSPQVGEAPAVGVQRVGNDVRVAIVSLCAPDERGREMLGEDELLALYEAARKQYKPRYINVFTNRGVELAYDAKPDDLEVIKVPHAIFSELEK